MASNKYTDDDVFRVAAEVQTMAQLLRGLGLRYAGGNYINMKRKLQTLNVDTSHWTGQSWSKDQQLKDWSNYKTAASLKKNLIFERGHRCENCLLSEWFGSPIAIELHHIDGDRTNNSSVNLQLLCPNCHALTDNWRGRNIS